MRAPISACLIVRNEPKIQQCLESIRPYVEEICVVDTGSSDDTPIIARKFSDRFEEWYGCNEGESKDGRIADFSAARNRSFRMASQPWVLWLDGDDILQNGHILKLITDRYSSLEKALVMFPYEYSHDHHGNCTCRHYRERLIKGVNFGTWMGPVHEVWVPQDGFSVLQNDDVVWIHKREGKVIQSDRNIRILENWLKEHDGPDADARMLYYTALEYGQMGNLAKSIEFHMRYTAKSGWDDEKCLSLIDLAKHHQSLGNYETSIEWATKALLVKEEWAEPRFALARAYYYMAQKGGPEETRNWERAINHARQGLALPPSITPLFINPLERRLDIHRYLNVALSRVGRVHEARDSVRSALDAAPDDPQLQYNDKFYTEIIAKQKLDQAIAELRSVEKVSEDQVQCIKAVFEGKFKKILKEDAEKPVSEPVSEPVRKSISQDSLDVVFFTGQAWEHWDPKFLESTGMGGSETMCWEMARRFSKMGHRVRVYADTPDPNSRSEFEGVEWLDFRSFLKDPNGPECDVMISSRIPELVDYPFKASLKLAWVHDVSMGGGLTNLRALKFDRFLCLSNWHKGFFLNQYPFIHEDSVIVTRNGIDLSRYTQTQVRDPHRMIYSSSPDRGLQVAMQCMPQIRAQVPDASLHVFYGFDNWEKHPDQGQQLLAQQIKGLLKAYEPFGVVAHGRVPGAQLALEQLKSGVWGYSTWFCCHPDTQISVPGNHRGGAPTVRIADLVGKSGFPVYAFNEKENRFQIATCNKVWETKIADELVGIELDSGEVLKVTPDHKVLTYDGDWVEAETLKPGDSLRALHYRYNVAIRDGNGRWTNEHRLVGEWMAGRDLLTTEHVNHLDLERLDNSPNMLEILTVSEHFSKTHKGKRLSKKHVAKKMEEFKRTMANIPFDVKSQRGKQNIKKLWDRVNSMTPEERQEWCSQRSLKKKATLLGEDRTGKNHKVVRIFRIPGPIPVYDMEVEGLHNFVANGVVVHNCETSCLTAMEAQAAGLRIVTSPIAALNETVGDRGKMIPGDWLSPEYSKAFTEAVVESMLKPGDEDRKVLQDYARNNFDLDTLAQDWVQMFRNLIQEVRLNPLPRYKPVAA